MEIDSAEEATGLILEEASRTEDGRPRWTLWASISTMIMAMVTAVGVLLSGITLNEFFVERTAQMMEVSRLGVDTLGIEVLESKHEILARLGSAPDPDELKRIEAFRAEARFLEKDIVREGEISGLALWEHELFAIGVTILSLAVALSAVSILLTRRPFWFASLGFGATGTGFVFVGVYLMFTA